MNMWFQKAGRMTPCPRTSLCTENSLVFFGTVQDDVRLPEFKACNRSVGCLKFPSYEAIVEVPVTPYHHHQSFDCASAKLVLNFLLFGCPKAFCCSLQTSFFWVGKFRSEIYTSEICLLVGSCSYHSNMTDNLAEFPQIVSIRTSC